MISAGEGRFEITMADRRDIAGWLLLVEQVVPLFGPMAGFKVILERKIAQKQAHRTRSKIARHRRLEEHWPVAKEKTTGSAGWHRHPVADLVSAGF